MNRNAWVLQFIIAMSAPFAWALGEIAQWTTTHAPTWSWLVFWPPICVFLSLGYSLAVTAGETARIEEARQKPDQDDNVVNISSRSTQ